MTTTLPTAPPDRRPRDASSPIIVAGSSIGAALATYVLTGGVAAGVVAALGTSAIWLAARTVAERARTARTDRVIAYVAQATRLALPVPDFCRAAALAETSGTRRALERLAEFVAASMPIGDALAAAMPEMSSRDVGLARVAEANGTLPSTLARLAAVREPTPGVTALAGGSTTDDGFVRPRPPLTYFALLLVGVAAVSLMLSIFVVPKFAQIFRDFGVPPPIWMRWANGARAGIDLRTGLVLLVVAVVAIVMFAQASRRPRPTRRGVAGGDVGRRLPIIDAWRNDRDRADLCQAVADALAARRPAHVAIGEAASLDVAPALAARAALWQTLVANGQPIGAAARAAGMPTIIGAIAGDTSSDAPDAFAFLARHFHARSERTHEWLRAIASPLLTLIAAVPIALIAYGLFDCMRLLVDAASPKNLGM